MIGKLRGIIDSTDDDSLIIDVGGVGYRVFAAHRTIAALEVGSAATLIIETHVREDHIHLYGFANATERDWFQLLCTVQGVGNKTALAMLSAYTPEHMSRAIMAKDIAAFKAISGIGPKLAERIVVELKDKVLKIGVGNQESGFSNKKPSTKHQAPSTNEDAISALVNLGYSRSDAYSAVLAAAEKLGSGAELNALIRAGLQEVARK